MKRKVQGDITCFFDEKYHSFKTSNGKRLTSVTKFSKQFFNEFDSEGISKAYAKKHGLRQEDVLRGWKEKSEKSIEIGNKCHLFAEHYLKGDSDLIIDSIKDHHLFEELYGRMQLIKQKLQELMQTKNVIGTEEMIFSEQLGVAGFVDLLMGDLDTLYIYDWKTNEKIEKNNKFQSCMKQLWAYPDCNFTHYRVQLNLYAHIINHENLFPQYKNIKMGLFHVQQNEIVFHEVEPFPISINLFNGGN